MAGSYELQQEQKRLQQKFDTTKQKENDLVIEIGMLEEQARKAVTDGDEESGRGFQQCKHEREDELQRVRWHVEGLTTDIAKQNELIENTVRSELIAEDSSLRKRQEETSKRMSSLAAELEKVFRQEWMKTDRELAVIDNRLERSHRTRNPFEYGIISTQLANLLTRSARPVSRVPARLAMKSRDEVSSVS